MVKVLRFHCFPRANWSSNFKTKRYCLYCSHSVLNSCHKLRTVRLQVMRCTAHYGQCLSTHMAVTVSSRQICLPSYPLFCTVVLCSIPARLISPKYFSFQYNAHCFWKTPESITSGSIWAQISHSACSKGAKIGRRWKVPCMLPLITKISDYVSAILIIRLHKISDTPESVRWEHMTQIEANNFILNILFWKFLRQTNKIMLI